MENSLDNYIFGYGSLINSESRARTGDTGAAIAVRVKGIQREWNFAAKTNRMTALGIREEPNSVANGVIFHVPKDQLNLFDNRERGYKRKVLSTDCITVVQNTELPVGNYWTYFTKHPQQPSIQCPILQSYIDVVLTGCLEFGDSFAIEFVRTTSYWNGPIENDRQRPRYVRPLKSVSKAAVIDTLLAENRRAGIT